MTPTPGQIDEARRNGYSDDEIAEYLGNRRADLAPKIMEARRAGYGSGEILGQLAGTPDVTSSVTYAGEQAPAAGYQTTTTSKIGPAPSWVEWFKQRGDTQAADWAPMIDAAQGAFARLMRMGATADDVMRFVTGREPMSETPEARRLRYEPPTAAGQAGAIGTDIAVSAIPGMRLSQGLRGAPLLTRMGAEAGYGAGVAGLQSGGDPRAMVAGGVMGGAGGGIGGRVPLKPQQQQARDAAIKFIERKGGSVSAGVRTGSPYLRALEVGSAQSPLGAIVAHKETRKTVEALESAAEQLQREAYHAPTSPLEAGRSVREGMATSAEQSKLAGRAGYTAFDAAHQDPRNLQRVQTGTETVTSGVLDAAGNPITTTQPVFKEIAIPADLRRAQKLATPVLEDIKARWPIAQQQMSKGLKALENIVAEGDFAPAKTLEDNLSALKELGRGEDRSAALARYLIPEVEKAVDDAAAKAGPDVLKSLREGRGHWAQKSATEDLMKLVTGKRTTQGAFETEPVEVFKSLDLLHDKGIETLGKVLAKTPGSRQKLSRALLDNILEKAYDKGDFSLSRAAGMLRDWRSIGDETKKLLYKDPKFISELDNLFVGMRLASENPNPSGTAVLGLAMGAGPYMLLTNPMTGITSTLAMGAFSKILYAPGAAKAFQWALNIPIVDKARSVGVFRNLMRFIPANALKPAPPEETAAQ